MKKFLLLTAIIITATATFATKITIKVQNFQFKPKNVNAKVGDTIIFKWVTAMNSIHTTTSQTIPAGAAPWDKPIDSAHRTFMYKLTVAGLYNYNCTFHAPAMKGTLNVTTALTAGLTELSVNDLSNKPLLTWATKSSKDISYFSVQKSTDGETFSEIAQVKAAANNSYRFNDNGQQTAKYIYYQVKMVDVNGNSELSSIKMYTSKTAVQKLVTSISPNPVSSPGHLMLQFNADANGKMLVEVFNSRGALIKQVGVGASKGLNNAHVHLGELSPGTYYINCTLGNLTEKYTIIYR